MSSDREFASTCWTDVRAAALGSAADRERFVTRYLPVVRAYVRARWTAPPMQNEIDDAVQEVFLECLKPGGAIERVEQRRPGSFRAFLHGVTRNVASRIEERRRGAVELTPSHIDGGVGGVATGADEAFTKAWAGSVVEEAAERMRERARLLGRDALARVEILRLRFDDSLPIRDIAPRLGISVERAHREYALARKEFTEALRETVAFHEPGSDADVDTECRTLLELLG